MKPRQLLPGFVVLLAALLAGLFLLAFPGQSEFFFLDLQFLLAHTFSPDSQLSDHIVLILLDENISQGLLSSKGLSPRAAHARVVEILRQAGAGVIAFDIAFITADPGADELFVRAAQASGNVIAGETDELKTVASLRGCFRAIGSLYTRDFWQLPRQLSSEPGQSGQRAFALEVADVFVARQHANLQHADWQHTDVLVAENHKPGVKRESQAILQDLNKKQNPDKKSRGEEFWINYKERPAYFPCFSYRALLESGSERLADPDLTPVSFLKDKIILIGHADDLCALPGLGGQKWPGLYVHAFAVDNLIRHTMLRKVPLSLNIIILLITLFVIQVMSVINFRGMKVLLPCLWLFLLFGFQYSIFFAYNYWLNYAALLFSGLLCILLNSSVRKIRNVRELRHLERTVDEFEAFRVQLENTALHKETLFDTVFHDLKNYVHSIETGINLLKMRSREDTNLQKKVEVIELACGNIASLVKNLLEVKQIEEAKLKLTKSPCTYEQIVALVQRLSTDPLREVKKIQLFIQPGTPNFSVSADPYYLERVLHNLLNNAFKYSFPGGTVLLSCKVQGEEKIVALFNESIPLTTEQQRLIFEKYYQGQAPASHSKGLGLHFCRLIMTAHAGRIWAESSETGNCFYLGFRE